MKGIIPLAFLLILGCRSYFMPPPPNPSFNFVSLINKEKKIDNTKIQFNGYYNNLDNLKMITNNSPDSLAQKFPNKVVSGPVIFFRNGLVYYGNKSSYSELSSIPTATQMYYENNWGTFEVNGDTINAIIYCQFSNGANEVKCYLPCNFRGITKDESTIVDWRMVEPYPKYDKFVNSNRVGNFLRPSTLKFIKAGGKNKFDIDSNAVWVNKYRK